MAANLFNRYIWLVNQIYSSGGISREEINRRWSRSHLNERHEISIPERTFHRHKEAIKELFGINIACDRSGDALYRITDSEDLEQNEMKSWLLNTFAVNNLFHESRHLKHRILFEEIPSGQRFLTPVIASMRDGRTINLTYRGFRHKKPSIFEIEPYCIKIFHQRWYMLGRSTSDGIMRVYSLDRVLGLEPMDRKFTIPEEFDAADYFADVIGVIADCEEESEPIEIEVTDGQQHYLRTLPLHRTQEEVECTDEYSVFTLRLKPTFDFIQELRKYGPSLRVRFPQWLRDRMVHDAVITIDNYNKKT